MFPHRVYTTIDDETLRLLTQRAKECDRSMAYMMRLGIEHLLCELDPERDRNLEKAAHPTSRAHLGLVNR